MHFNWESGDLLAQFGSGGRVGRISRQVDGAHCLLFLSLGEQAFMMLARSQSCPSVELLGGTCRCPAARTPGFCLASEMIFYGVTNSSLTTGVLEDSGTDCVTIHPGECFGKTDF